MNTLCGKGSPMGNNAPLHPYAAALLPSGYRGSVLTWKHEGPEGPVHYHATVEAFSASLGRPMKLNDEWADADAGGLGWMTRGQARRLAKERGAYFVEF